MGLSKDSVQADFHIVDSDGSDSALSAVSQQGDHSYDLGVVHEAAKLIGNSDTPELAITGILRLMSEFLGLNRGRVLLPSESGDCLQIRFSYGLQADERSRGVYHMDDGITGKVMSRGMPAVVQNIDEEPEFLYRAIDRATLPPGIVSFLAVPIFDGDNPIGVLAAHRLRERSRPFDADLTVLRILSTLVAQIIQINQLIEQRTEQLQLENKQLKGALDNQYVDHGILGESQSIREALHKTKTVAGTDVTTFLSGESGTGKERFSQLLHLGSARKDSPFLAINCAAIPEHLLESELFGHERGAFTGAVAVKKGKLELATGGTLFLDEIGDLSLELQSKLLRVLEGRVIQRVGGLKDIPIDVRIIAATHKNLQQAVNNGEFRLDLFYRLNVFPIHLPPLREREGDVRILARHFLLTANQEYAFNSVFSNGVLTRLESYAWPGNIRQLENVIRRAVLTSSGGSISVGDIEMILRQESAISGTSAPVIEQQSCATQAEYVANDQALHSAFVAPAFQPDLAGFSESGRLYSRVNADQFEQIIAALKQTGGNKTRAARLLGMTSRQFRYRLEKLNIQT